MKLHRTLLCLMVLSTSTTAIASGNENQQSFSKAKRILQNQVYYDNRVTLYCGAEFDKDKNIITPEGFVTTKHVKRAKRVEWEHVVPAENFGRNFKEWREGDKRCINSKGKTYKGRKCAEKLNIDYRYMQADMHNLFPAIGAVNAMRSNYNFTMLPQTESGFGSCDMRIRKRKAEPPIASRGRIARTYLYMEKTYSNYHMSKQQRQLMNAWDKQFPVTDWECKKAYRISQLQGNVNVVVKARCNQR